jgi:hypothetical protein
VISSDYVENLFTTHGDCESSFVNWSKDFLFVFLPHVMCDSRAGSPQPRIPLQPPLPRRTT